MGGAKKAIVAAIILSFALSACAQDTKPPQPDAVIAQELNKYPGLLPELGQLIEKLRNNVQLPAPRDHSQLSPLLPGSTTYYAALPNYGEAAHQALAIFQEELKQSVPLRDWWSHGDMAKTGPQLEASIERFSEVSEYLGNEIVITGSTAPDDSNMVVIAQIRKPGLKDALQRILRETGEKTKLDLRIVDSKELGTVTGTGNGHAPVVLVRPDLVFFASSIDTARKFDSLLDRKAGGFADAPFGQRIERVYEGGTTAVAGANLQKILSYFPAKDPNDRKAMERFGIQNAQYFVWDHKRVGDLSLSESELSFDGVRHGIASWLAPPAPLGTLDFISPKSAFVLSLKLKISPRSSTISGTSLPIRNRLHLSCFQPWNRPCTSASGTMYLANLTVRLRSKWVGSGTPQPTWRAILHVLDSDRLQSSLDRIVQSLPVQAHETTEDGVKYHTLQFPSSPKPVPVAYAFVDGYLIVSSKYEMVREAVQLHKSGETLAKSSALVSSVPPGYSPETSLLLYENASSITNLRLSQLSPEIANVISQATSQATPTTIRAYADESSVRSVTASGRIDISAILVGAAIAIPNLLRARIAANEASTVAALRTVNTAEISYSVTYPQKGFSRDLASLGNNPKNIREYTPNHAGLIDDTLGGANCTAGQWCVKTGYRFTVAATCPVSPSPCGEYVVIASPVSSSTGTRNFCSTSDAVIRFHLGPELASPISASECKRWSPLN